MTDRHKRPSGLIHKVTLRAHAVVDEFKCKEIGPNEKRCMLPIGHDEGSMAIPHRDEYGDEWKKSS